MIKRDGVNHNNKSGQVRQTKLTATIVITTSIIPQPFYQVSS